MNEFPVSCRQAGFAVPLLTLVLAAMGFGGLGMLALAGSELATARIHRDVLEATLAAESAVRWARSTIPVDSLPGGRSDGGSLSGEWSARARFEVRAHPLDREYFAIEAIGTVDPDLTRGAARVFWRFDPIGRIAARIATLEVGGSASGEGIVRPVDREEADRWVGPGFRPVPVAVTGPMSSESPSEAESLPLWGPLTAFDLAAAADLRIAGGSVTPGPSTSGGSCDVSDIRNWGAPAESEHPCSGFLPIVISDGDLILRGGTGAGILIVFGNLTLRQEAVYEGWILATGNLTLAEGASAVGFGSAGGVGSVENMSEFRGSISAVFPALERLGSRVPASIPIPIRSRLGGRVR